MILLNKNMPAEVFDILRRAAERLLSLRGVGLDGGFTVSLEVDGGLCDERLICSVICVCSPLLSPVRSVYTFVLSVFRVL